MFALAELYDCVISHNTPIQIGDRKYEKNEPILHFQEVARMTINETVKNVNATGGFDNRARVNWRTTKEVQVTLTKGVLSEETLSLLASANLTQDFNIEAPMSESFESMKNGNSIVLTREPISGTLFIHSDLGQTITDYEIVDKTITFNTNPFLSAKKLVVYYNCISMGSRIKVGNIIPTKDYKLIGKMKKKDEDTGIVTTSVITIPNFCFSSPFNATLGDSVKEPIIGEITGMGIPVGDRLNSYALSIDFLNENLEEVI